MDDFNTRQCRSTVTVLRAWLRRHGLAWVEARLSEARQKEIDADARRAANVSAE